MAARSASIASFVLLLLLVAVPSSSNLHVKFDLRGSVYPHGEIYAIMKIGAPALEYNLHVDTGSVLTWVQCTVPRPTYCKGPCNTGNGNVCFGIFQTPIPGTNLIGAVTMQDRIMIYDNEEEKIGWVHGPCRIESESEITSRL
ncbi:hypothetical protein PR202_gb06301 [Eleusine coracana subsp. coracana]|uniref:Peptidase A1 domain-containing protein n=1 Tax=Eleusine coracana subsp. coracana TaxID=191504 RepID=A0AAV5E9A1_ELECO|nr:hypothetical protein PR202_gb06301 [Eleusine coracana subsp. coracana]